MGLQFFHVFSTPVFSFALPPFSQLGGNRQRLQPVESRRPVALLALRFKTGPHATLEECT